MSRVTIIIHIATRRVVIVCLHEKLTFPRIMSHIVPTSVNENCLIPPGAAASVW